MKRTTRRQKKRGFSATGPTKAVLSIEDKTVRFVLKCKTHKRVPFFILSIASWGETSTEISQSIKQLKWIPDFVIFLFLLMHGGDGFSWLQLKFYKLIALFSVKSVINNKKGWGISSNPLAVSCIFCQSFTNFQTGSR